MKILDFGIAKLHVDQKQTATGVALGTPLYMAPEQWEAREDMDGRVDIYALGMILYEALTGTYPFDAKNALQLMYAHTKKPVPDPGERVPLPDRLRRLVLSMVQKLPEERPASMAVIEAELAQVLVELGGAGASAELSPVAAGPPRPMAATGDPVLSFTAEPSMTGQGFNTSQLGAAARSGAAPAAALAQSSAAPAALAQSAVAAAALPRSGATAEGPAGATATSSAPAGASAAASTPAGGSAVAAQSLAALAAGSPPRSRSRLPVLLAGGAFAAIGAVVAAVLSLRPGPAGPRPIAEPLSPAQTSPAAAKRERPSPLIELGPGRFLVGRPGLVQQTDGPAYPVDIPRFAIEAYEVSAAQLAEYVQAVHPIGMSPPSAAAISGNLPAVQVTRDQAKGYCAWRYPGGRLPLEAEWEYAARDGRSERLYPWPSAGPDPTLGRLGGRANLGSLSPQLESVDSRPLGKTQSGIFNLLGNAAEWTLSASSPYPGSRAAVARGLAVVRGGSALSPAHATFATTRQFVPETQRDSFIGFRCAIARK